MMNGKLLIVAAMVCFTLIVCAVVPRIITAECIAGGMRYGYDAELIKDLCK